MAISRVITWSAGQTLTAAALNAEFDNILNNALSLVSPWTANMAAGGFRLTGLSLGSVSDCALSFTSSDTNTGLMSLGADQLSLVTAGTARLYIGATGQVGIGTTSPTTSTSLDIVSTTGALKIPVMTTTQRDALTGAAGMIIFNSTTDQIENWDVSGAAWAAT